MNIASEFQIKDNRVLSLTTEVNPDFESEKYHSEFRMNCSTKHAEQLHEGKRIARLFCDFEIELTPDNLRESSYAMLKITDVGTFEINPEITMDQFDKMLRLNGMATLIPIIRGIVLNVSSTLMVRIPMLVPNINVTQIEWEKSKQEE